MVSVLVLLTAGELADLGTEPYLEILTLTKSAIHRLFGGIAVKSLGLGFGVPNLELFLRIGLGLG